MNMTHRQKMRMKRVHESENNESSNRKKKQKLKSQPKVNWEGKNWLVCTTSQHQIRSSPEQVNKGCCCCCCCTSDAAVQTDHIQLGKLRVTFNGANRSLVSSPSAAAFPSMEALKIKRKSVPKPLPNQPMKRIQNTEGEPTL